MQSIDHTNLAELLMQKDATAEACVRFPKNTQWFITTSNLSTLKHTINSNPNRKYTTTILHRYPKNFQTNTVTINKKRHKYIVVHQKSSKSATNKCNNHKQKSIKSKSD